MAHPFFLRIALILVLLSAACGDDDGTGPIDAGTTDAPRGDAGGRVCTDFPEVVDTGMTAPEEADIDPADFDMAVATMFDPAAVGQDDAVFTMGIQAGAMRDDGMWLWTFVEGSADVVVRVWRESATAGEVLLAHEETVTPAEGYAKVNVTGLAPATRYQYAFFVPGAMAGTFDGRSPIGRVRTAPAAGMMLKMRVATTTCTGSASEPVRTESLPYPALSVMAMEEPDALFQLGDFSYNDNSTTLEEYRAEWLRTLNVGGYRDLLPVTGQYITWDDHEVDDNYDPETIPPARMQAAMQAYFEAMPMETLPDNRLWRSFSWGDTAEIIVMDLRSERRPSTIDTDTPVFISDEQMAFVKERLMSTTAHFKIVFSSVNITNLDGAWQVGLSLDDRWEGYDEQRIELLDFIVDNDIRNVWFLAGDIHMGFVGRIEPEGHPYSHMWELTIGPGASAENVLSPLLESGAVTPNDVFQCDRVPWGHGRTNVATMLELDPLADTIHVVYTDALTGEVMLDQVLQQER